MRSDQTPAPSKRFLTPRFSSSAAQSTPSFPESQPFAPSATPLPRTLRFVTPAKQHKEPVNVNYEDEALGLSNSRLQAFTPCHVRGADAIDDIDVDVDVELLDASSVNHSINADLIDGIGTLDDMQTANFALSHSRRKRRKITTPTKRTYEPVVISSSPSLHPLTNTSVDNDDDDGKYHDSSSDLDLEPELDPDSPSSKRATFARYSSRFKMASSSVGPVPTSPPEDAERSNKPIFRQPDPKLHIAAEMATTLPDAFTPSRRKNRREYLPGGLADSIRNSVLGIATEISQSSATTVSGRLEGKLVPVKSAHVDTSGHAIIATAFDGVQWVLPASHHRRRGGEVEELSHQVQRIRMGQGFLIFGSASHWALPNIQTENGEMVHFASYWDIPLQLSK